MFRLVLSLTRVPHGGAGDTIYIARPWTVAGTQTSNSKRPASDTAVGPAARVRGGGCCPPRGGSDGRRGPRPPPSSAAPGTEVGDKGDFRVPAVIYQTLLLSAVRSPERGSEDRSGRGGAGRGGRLPLALRRAASQGASGPTPPPSSGSVWPRRLSSVSAAGLRWVCGGSGFRSGLRVRRRLPVSIGRLGRVQLPVSVIDVRHRCPELGPASGLGSDSLPVRGRVRCLVSVIGVWVGSGFRSGIRSTSGPGSGPASGVCHRCSSSVSGSGPVSGLGSDPLLSTVGSGVWCLSSVFVIGVWVGYSFRSGFGSTFWSGVGSGFPCLSSVSVIGVCHRCPGSGPPSGPGSGPASRPRRSGSGARWSSRACWPLGSGPASQDLEREREVTGASWEAQAPRGRARGSARSGRFLHFSDGVKWNILGPGRE